jgi:hypothetical protein
MELAWVAEELARVRSQQSDRRRRVWTLPGEATVFIQTGSIESSIVRLAAVEHYKGG